MKGLLYFLVILSIAVCCMADCLGETSDHSRVEHVCVTMFPIHPDGNGGTIPVQSGPSPFVLMTLQNQVRRGEEIGIALTSVMNKTDIRGYYIQARKLEDYSTIVGRFSDYQNHGMLYDCQSLEDTLLHDGTDLKYQPLLFKWTAPEDFTGTVVFWATVAESFQRFWIGIYSTPVVIV